MGNCWSKEIGSSVRLRWDRGRSRSGALISGSSSQHPAPATSSSRQAPATSSSRQAPATSSSRQAPSTSSSRQAPSTSSSRQAPSTSSSQQAPSQQASISDLLRGLRSCMKDVSNLEQILQYVDKALDVSQGATVKAPDLISSNLDDAEKVLEETSKLNREVQNKDKLIDIRTALADVLGGVGNLHWITFGFFVVAFVLRRVNQVAGNKNDCLEILKYLRQVGKHLQDLVNTPLQDEDNNFQEAVAVIVEGAILCVSQLDSSFLSRFASTSATKDDLSTLKEKINRLYPDWNLRVSKDIHKLTSKPLKPYKATYPDHAVGLEQSIRDIMKLLEAPQQTSPQKTPAILLHGIGGIGKTTLGEAVCAKIAGSMSIKVAKVEIGENPGSKKICKCQNDILERLSGKKQTIGLPSEGKELLALHLKQCHTPIFLFIDNVFQKEDLEMLLPRELTLPSNSYLIATSRSEMVSQALHKADIQWKRYRVRELDRSKANDLLNKILEDCPADKEKQLDTVLSLCGGWPLALEVVGSHLRGQKDSQSAWDSTIESLRMCDSVSGLAGDEDKLVHILRWSYDKVNNKCQSVFLDICSLLRGADWSWVETLGIGSEASNLRARSLVKKGGERVQVHDLLVALAVQESSSTRRVYCRGDSLPSILEADCGENECEHVEGIVLDGGNILAVKLDAVHNTLRILCLHSHVKITGKCQKIPSNLQIYSVDKLLQYSREFPYGDLSPQCSAAIPYSDLSGLDNLRLLNFDAVDFDFEPIQLPKRLQIFQVKRMRSRLCFHARAFENCNSLHTVRIQECFGLKKFPASFYFCPIRVLILSKNRDLKSFPEDFSRLQSLETFILYGSHVREFPSGLAHLLKVREAFVEGCEQLPENFQFSPSAQLEHLHLNFSRANAQQLVHGFGNLHSLQTLHVVGAASLEYLSDNFSRLTALEYLSFKRCQQLRELPEGCQNLPALSELNLSGCKRFQRLPDGFVELSALRILTLAGCEELRELPEGFQNLLALSELDLSKCKGLQWLPTNFDQLKNLRKLILRECKSLSKLPEGFQRLHALSILDMCGMDSLEQWPGGTYELTSLQDLYLNGRESLLASIDFRGLRSLKTLRLIGCGSLTSLPEAFGSLSVLRALDLRECRRLCLLQDDISQVTSFQSLWLTGCKMLEDIPSGIGNLLALWDLNLMGGESLQTLPDSFSRLESLQMLNLNLSECKSLKELPGGFTNLRHLWDINLNGCSSLEKLPDDLGNLSALEYLELSGCRNLETLPEAWFDWKI